ncbi:hypothetical protein JCM1840_004243 [Sporobolomyces johnsonii]
MSTTTTSSTLTAGSHANGRAHLELLPSISTHTWPQWREALPEAVSLMTGLPGIALRLDGRARYPGYTIDEVILFLDEPERDPTKVARYNTWVKITVALKHAVVKYGGADAAARLEGFDTNLGDAPKLWKELSKWYGETEGGVEKILALYRVLNLRWDEAESPALHFARTYALWAQLNTSYKADAELSTDTTNPDVVSDRTRAISTPLQRDLFLASLPRSMLDILGPSIKRTTSYDEVRNLVTNLWTTRAAHDEIAEIEARRVSTLEIAMRTMDTGAQGAPAQEPAGEGSQGYRNGRGRARGVKRPARSAPVRHSATRFEGWQGWPDGTFTDRDGKVRLKIKPGRCFTCLAIGHLRSQCSHARDSIGAARARVEELRKHGVAVPIEDANALVAFDLNPGSTHDSAVVDALIASATLSQLAHRVEVDPGTQPPSPVPTPADIVLPESTLLTIAALRTDVTTPLCYILDGGATRHFTTSLDHLSSYVAYPDPIAIGGAFASIGKGLGEGTLTFRFGANTLVLPNVMYAPALGVNLVSHTRLMMSGYRFTNDDATLSMWYPDGVTFLTSFPVAPTLYIEASRLVLHPPPSRALATKADDAALWHSRLGHPSDDRLKHAVGIGGAGSVSGGCDACIAAKATRKGVAHESEGPATRKLERLAADTWGPAPVRGKRGERYALGIVDGYTRYGWVETMPSKLGIAQRLVNRIRIEERSEGSRVAAVQTDNGTEFANSTLDSFLSGEGIRHRLTVPYVHNQNGMVERRWRQWLETTRALLFASRLPSEFWPHALSTAVYLYNLSPSSALDGRSPHEAYYGKVPSLSHLRPWGCTAWLSLPREGSYRTSKLDARAVKARFVGYPKDQKGWTFWVAEWGKVVTWWEVEHWVEGDFGDEEDRNAEDWLADFDDEFVDSAVAPAPQGEWQQASMDHDALDDALSNVEANTPGAAAQPDPPSPIAPLPPSTPSPPSPPAPRRSGRLAGSVPSHFVPLAGAPPGSLEGALRVVVDPPADTSSLLSLAVLDLDLDKDSDAIVVGSIDAAAPVSRHALEHALSTSPAWTGSLDQPSFAQAVAGPDAQKWFEAFDVELGAFDATGTWDKELVDLPPGRKAIAVKWVLLIKRDSDGQIIKYKARLVARGDMQIDGVDYDETHSSTVRLTTVRLIFALLAAHPSWNWAQFDISNAYLLGTLSNELYIRQPPGFIDQERPKAVRRLRKALYGLKQGGREWQKVLRGALEGMGFRRVESDHGLYVRRRAGRLLLVPTHVDDGMVIGDDDVDEALEDLNRRLENKLKRVDTGLFLGMRVRRSADGSVELDQGHYARSVLDRFFPHGLSPVSTPLDSSYADASAATEDERHVCPFRELLGALIYLSACTRPDLAFALSLASRFASCPAKRHWSILQHICRYLAGTTSLGLRYLPPTAPFSSALLTAWSDADHGADKDTRRSVSSFVFGFGDDSLRSTAVSWLSRRQKSVSTSTLQAEYIGLSEASREALWLRQLLREMGYPTPRPTLIRGDNSGSLLLASHPTSHSRTKHIAIHYHFTRELVEDGTVVLQWVPTADMVADVFTKGLPKVKHVLFTARCGIRDLRHEGECESGGPRSATKIGRQGGVGTLTPGERAT